MSNTPQQPADGWQPQQQPPVYRPNEEPPAEEPPPWSPESQRMSNPMSQRMPVEDVDGTVKYVGGPGTQSPPPRYGPPPGVPVSPFDSPQQPMHPAQPPMQASDPFGGGPGMPPVSGMPVSGMPPVSSVPASAMPVSSPAPGQPPYGQPPFGGGQFGPQGGQLVPVSGGGAQPWGAPDTIKRKKQGGKGPMWLLLVGIVVIAVALGVGGFVLFNPGGDATDQESGTIETSTSAEAAPQEGIPDGMTVLANEASGINVLVPEGSADATTPPEVFTDVTGSTLTTGPTIYFGTLDSEAIGVADDVAGLSDNLRTLAAEWAGGTAEGAESLPYRVDARTAEFATFTVGENTVMTAIIQSGDGYVGFVGVATADQVDALESARASLTFGS